LGVLLPKNEMLKEIFGEFDFFVKIEVVELPNRGIEEENHWEFGSQNTTIQKKPEGKPGRCEKFFWP
jgi:hypothetical protein